METGEGFKSVMDHGVEVSTEHLPKIPCSKFTIIGNSRMRNKKPVRKKEPMWKVPKGARRHQKDQSDSKQSPELKRKSLEPRFGNHEELNRFDKNGIYGEAFHRTLELMHPGTTERDPTLHYPESKIERKYIDDFYRDKTSLFLPNYGTNGDKGFLRKSGHVSLPLLRDTEAHQQTKQCQGNARHYCDVVGQRYCTACLRMHRLDKLAVKAKEKLQWYPNSKSQAFSVLPKIRNNTHTPLDRDYGLTETTPTSRTTRTKTSLLLLQNDVAARGWETTGEFTGSQPIHQGRKRRKLVQRSSVLDNKLPDIATDNESRHLTS